MSPPTGRLCALSLTYIFIEVMHSNLDVTDETTLRVPTKTSECHV